MLQRKLRRILSLLWWFKHRNNPLGVMMRYHYIAHVKKSPKRVSVLTGSAWVQELLSGNDDRFEEVARMPKDVFMALVKELLEQGQLKPTKQVSANEQVAIWNVHPDTTRRCSIAPTCPRQLKVFPFFANCRMAVDGTHIPVSVPTKDVKAYQGRKGVTQNVLAACDFNMVFTYVLAGWEGSAGDGRIYADALEKGYVLSDMKYDIMDAGFALTLKCLTPYRGMRYHLKEYGQGSQKPRSKEELFNLRHAMLRNVVERIFGVLKKRFPVMSSPVEYDIGFQVDMVLSLCTVHNFIRLHGCTNDIYVQEATQELRARNKEPMQLNDHPNHHPDLESTEAKAWRDQVATDMWNQYQLHCNRRRDRRLN
ncbi:hypothetical protein LEN26_018578 [Aphanomyces euteiches]|nr:hypothetical protein LEN26_018578 [Aphanomyces euteiches]